MSWFRKYYQCECGTSWTDEWSCLCNDRCPSCNKEIEPYNDEDLTVIVDQIDHNNFEVLVSPDDAEHAPDYEVVAGFDTHAVAEAYAETLRQQGA